jgi:UDP-galactopyranose mutase
VPAHDVVVIGGGFSGLAFAAHAARAGRSVHVVEAADRLGGCVHTHAGPDGFWIELGAHTMYNSYGATLELLEALGLLGELQPRAQPILRFLDGDTVLPGKNLGALLRHLHLGELLFSLPRALGARAAGRTVAEHYARLVGARNYAEVIGPLLSAVPSQSADPLPADMLFKKRPRRKDVLRSFTLRGGLGRIAERIAALPGVTASLGRAAARLARAGAGHVVTLDDGEELHAEVVALALPPHATAALLAGVLPEAAARVATVGEAHVDSVGVVVAAERCALPPATFLIPRRASFFSVVTRDVVPDRAWRGFVFHFRPGASADERLERVSAVLGVPRAELAARAERHTVLPAPVAGHADVVAALDAALAGGRLAVTGNWFAGLALEDCALRSCNEYARISVT